MGIFYLRANQSTFAVRELNRVLDIESAEYMYKQQAEKLIEQLSELNS